MKKSTTTIGSIFYLIGFYYYVMSHDILVPFILLFIAWVLGMLGMVKKEKMATLLMVLSFMRLVTM